MSGKELLLPGKEEGLYYHTEGRSEGGGGCGSRAGEGRERSHRERSRQLGPGTGKEATFQ